MEKTYEFKLSEVNTILGALGKLPAEQSMQLIMFIQGVVSKQIEEAKLSLQEPSPQLSSLQDTE